jgi:serine/threonine protein kinase
MALTAGTRLGPYEILAPIGAGGMGEVYRARDTKLDRDVAIKVLPPSFAQDPERLARFEREAKVLASLNHPNIAQIYGIEERALIMELVDGQTLPGPLPLETALNYARQIADALETAHEKNIIHRDLKPANIMITPAGVVKVLDFGLAALPNRDHEGADPVNSPTLTISPTRAGMILGTAAYMSPEQARGKAVDKRADIWAFGVVLYEMLTGKRLFEGETVSDTLAQVLTKQPDWEQVPAKVRRLLKKCLEKDPKKRLRDIGDAWELLEDAPIAAAPSRSRVSVAGWIAAAMLLLALIGLSFVHFRKAPPPEERSVRFQVPWPEKSSDAIFRLSPDGRYLAIAGSLNSSSRLWVRPLDSLEARVLPGTEEARFPFWSPDSAFIGFFAQGKLKRIALAGGPPQAICDAPRGLGGTWNRDGVIVFTPDFGMPLYRVPAAGGGPAPVTKLAGSVGHAWPQFLPRTDRFLYFGFGVGLGKREASGIYVGSLDEKPPVHILAGSAATYAPPDASSNTGYLLFLRERTLMAQSFDPERLRLRGDLVPLAEPVGTEVLGFLPAFSVSDGGVLAYSSGEEGANRELVWLDRTGKLIGSAGPPGEYSNFRLSPDEKRIVMDRSAPQSAPDIWVLDLLRGVTSRLTFDPATDNLPIWSPDGQRVVFPSSRKGLFDLYIKAASGAGQEELLIKLGTPTGWATDWSRDGRFILYQIPGVNTGQDLWIAPQFGDRKPFPYLQTQFNEQEGAFSPDGRWIAYVSDESGRDEIYVQAFPLSGEKHEISTGGGSEPYWKEDGRELFYMAADRNLMAVPVTLGTTITPGTPKALFPVPASALRHSYAVTADGQRFLVTRSAGEMPPITVVLNWQAELKK